MNICGCKLQTGLSVDAADMTRVSIRGVKKAPEACGLLDERREMSTIKEMRRSRIFNLFASK